MKKSIIFLSTITALLLYGCAGLPNLQQAAKDGDLKTVRDLINKGANINQRTDGGRSTALHFAASNDQIETVKELIKKGADPNLRDIRGRTPIFYGNYPIIEILINAGADLNVRGILDYNPLLRTIDSRRKDKEQIIKLFLKSGANFNAQDIRGMTVIHIAVLINEKPEIMDLLLSNVDDVNVKNNQGLTPRDIACLLGRKSIIDKIDEYGGKSTIYTIKDSSSAKLIQGKLTGNTDGTLGLKRTKEISVGVNSVGYTIKWKNPVFGRSLIQVDGWFFAEPNHTYRVDSYGGYYALSSYGLIIDETTKAIVGKVII